MTYAPDNWSAHQLTTFLGALAPACPAADVANIGIQRITEAVDAEIGALVGAAGVVCSIGFPYGEAPEQTIGEAIESGSGTLVVPGVGEGHSLVMPIEDELLTSLLLVRLGDDPFSREEVNLVAGMVRVVELALQNRRAFEAERAIRASLQERQSLLERLARIERSISLRAPLVDVLDAITQGAAELFRQEVVGLRLVDPDDPTQLVLVSSYGLTPDQERELLRQSNHSSAGGRAFVEQRLVIVDDYQHDDIGVPKLRADRLQAAMAAPVREDGKIAGSLTVATYRAGHVYSESEQEMLLALAEHASLALTDARMIEAMRVAEQEKDAMLADVLAGIEEREQLEGQLRQVQKMEAIGQLAGGIAHDFNNLLMIILGAGELVADSLDSDDPGRGHLAEIIGAAERAAGLTHQLLAFSRKEIVQPQVVRLDEVVPDLLALLRRTIRESIEIDHEGTPDLWSTMIDRSQLEQVLVNLSVNAGDAMPGGGTLRVTTENRVVDEGGAGTHPGLVAGDYVVLSVCDTGAGMTPEVAARAFEPFYTTKPRGSGTGLGLATVYGIVQQAGGSIFIDSEPGRGTTVSVYLPATEARARTVEPAAAARREPGGETILLVEDEDGVRGVVTRILERNGYHVLSARSGAEALETAAAHPGRIALALTDVVMPGLSGPDFADRVKAVKPDLKIVFMSGYPDDVAAELGVLDPHTNYLQKPFGEAAVLETLARALEAPVAPELVG